MLSIDLVWLNRIGIILNLFAGFMMAPDLIGRDRLRKIERTLEERLKRREFSLRLKYKINPGFYFDSLIIVLGLLISTSFWSITSYMIFRDHVFTFKEFKFLILIVLVAAISLIIALLLELFPLLVLFFPPLLIRHVEIVFKCGLWGSVVLVWGLPVGGYLSLVYVLPRMVGKLLRYLISHMEGEDNLVSGLLLLGIAFFIIGNLFQLLATLKEASK